MNNKAEISPVVATALLLVVAVTLVVGFQAWYNTLKYGEGQPRIGDLILNTTIEGDIYKCFYHDKGSMRCEIKECFKIENTTFCEQSYENKYFTFPK